jgi:hypothetical protein
MQKSSRDSQTFALTTAETPQNTMASVYKSLSKNNGHKEEGSANGVKKNKQRVLILSSRGITYRLVSPELQQRLKRANLKE